MAKSIQSETTIKKIMKDKNLFTEENRQKELRLIEAETNPMLQLYLFQLHTRIWDEHDAGVKEN